MAPLINFAAPALFRPSIYRPKCASSSNTSKYRHQYQCKSPTRMISTHGTEPDVLVIGGGIIGLSSALELAANGAKVCVLTRNFEESASRNAAGMLGTTTEGLTSGPLSVLAQESTKLYPDFTAKLDQNVSYVSRDDFLVPYLSDESIPVDCANGVFRGDVLRSIEPALGADIVAARRIIGDFHLDNRQLLRSLAATCTGNIEIRVGVDVQHLQSDASSRRIDYAIATTGEVFRADHYLVTTGAWTHKLLPNVPIRPVKGQMMSLSYDEKHITDALPTHVLHGSEIYIVPKPHLGLHFIGATVEDNASFRRNTTAEAALKLLNAAIKIVPAFAQCEIREHWAGLRPATPDLMPIIGITDYNNLSVATGTYRNGVLFAPAVAKLAAACVSGKHHELNSEMQTLLDAFSLQRFYGKNKNQHQDTTPKQEPVASTMKETQTAAKPPLNNNNIPYRHARNVPRSVWEEHLLNEARMNESELAKTPSFTTSTTSQNCTVRMSRSEMEQNLLRETNNTPPSPSPSFITTNVSPPDTISAAPASQNGVDHSTTTPSDNSAININNVSQPDSAAAPVLVFRTRPDGVQEPVRPSARYLKRMTQRNEQSATMNSNSPPPPPPSYISSLPVSTSTNASRMGTSNNAYDDVLQHRDQAEAKLKEGLRANRRFSVDIDTDSSPDSSTLPVSNVPITTPKKTQEMGTSNDAYDDVLQHRDQAEAKLREGLQANRNFSLSE